jgi:hypothetical protein
VKVVVLWEETPSPLLREGLLEIPICSHLWFVYLSVGWWTHDGGCGVNEAHTGTCKLACNPAAAGAQIIHFWLHWSSINLHSWADSIPVNTIKCSVMEVILVLGPCWCWLGCFEDNCQLWQCVVGVSILWSVASTIWQVCGVWYMSSISSSCTCAYAHASNHSAPLYVASNPSLNGVLPSICSFRSSPLQEEIHSTFSTG